MPFFVFKWGAGMSPVLYRDMVLFCQDDDLNPALYAFDKATGKLRWKDDRIDMAVNYSHPVDQHGRRAATRSSSPARACSSATIPRPASRRWYAKTLLRNIKTTPVCVDGVIYISVQSGGIANQWLASVDQAETGNNDGKIDKAEMQAFVGKHADSRGFLQEDLRSRRPQQRRFSGRRASWTSPFCIPTTSPGPSSLRWAKRRPTSSSWPSAAAAQGDVTDSHVLWKHATKHTDHIVSPFVSDGRMLLVKGGGISTVFDTQTGEPLRRPQANRQRQRLFRLARLRRRQDLCRRRKRQWSWC